MRAECVSEFAFFSHLRYRFVKQQFVITICAIAPAAVTVTPAVVAATYYYSAYICIAMRFCMRRK